MMRFNWRGMGQRPMAERLAAIAALGCSLALSGCGFRDGFAFEVGQPGIVTDTPIGARSVGGADAAAAKVDQRGLRLCPLFPLKLQAQCIVTML